MIIKRSHWIDRIEQAWSRKSIIWLSGVRRVGKTCLCQSLENTLYFDCELPRVRRMLEDPEGFLEDRIGKRIVLDEIHRLPDPAQVLKISADHFPSIKIIATGSSSLQASRKFKDSLTGRKEEIWLTPMISEDLECFGRKGLEHRFLHGGLPPFFLQDTLPEKEFQEWVDSYWAKDVLELFRLERRSSFFRFMELLFISSGGIFEATRYSRPCEVSRTTISNYLAVLEATWVVHVVRPFSTYRPTEIVSAPKVYAFDTGFVCYFKGWDRLRPEDMGLLWEHYVMNELHGRFSLYPLRYWRNKRGKEVNFVLVRRQRPPIAIECKWSAEDFDPSNIFSFRKVYPEGKNIVIAKNVDTLYKKRYKGVEVTFCPLEQVGKIIANG